MTPEEAIETAARLVLAEAAKGADSSDYPDIGERDWAAMVAKMTDLAPMPEQWREAYELLAARAGQARESKEAG